MYLIFGLGNPGQKYQNTRHNFGQMVLESLAGDLDTNWKKHKSGNDILKTKFGQKLATLCIPNCFMNESGQPVQAAAKFFKVKTKNIIVVYDDIDLPFGKIRISINKSAGGHNGLKSIIDYLGQADFLRLRLGIGPQKGVAEKYVLQKFNAEQKKQLAEIIGRAELAIHSIVNDGLVKAANQFN